MTQDEIFEMRKQADLLLGWPSDEKNLKAFAKLIAEKAIKEALAQPEQEPVAFVHGDDLDNLLDDRVAFIQRTKSGHRKTALYTTPPQRKPLTEAEIFKALESDIEQMELVKQDPEEYAVIIGMARAIEAAHNIKE